MRSEIQAKKNHRPLAGGPNSHYGDFSKIYNSSTMTEIAARHSMSIGLLILSWFVQRGIIPIPHTSSPTRMAENLRLITLADDEVQRINDLHVELGQQRLMDLLAPFWSDDLIPGKGKTMKGWTVQEMGWEDAEGNWLV